MNLVDSNMNVIITMAGLGKRFRDAGYDCPKYEIVVHGKTLFYWSMLSLRSFIEAKANFIFVVRKEDNARIFIEQQSHLANIHTHQILEIDELTDGQATSALLGGSLITQPELPFIVYNIDTFVHPSSIVIKDIKGNGWIPCFPGKGDGWSFAKVDNDNRVLDLREKVRISDHATIGLYWFSSFTLYQDIYLDYYSNPANIEKGEKYIAPMYRDMLNKGLDVYIHNVPFDAVSPLGTPAEVQQFISHEPPLI